jgi:sulfatase maturation enzyme AslB (radical SAM superfamily)
MSIPSDGPELQDGMPDEARSAETSVRSAGTSVPASSPQLPLQTLVLNVTNQCNLSCTYCYEYGEDKIVDTENGKQPKFMSEETARASVDFMLREAAPTRPRTSRSSAARR